MSFYSRVEGRSQTYSRKYQGRIKGWFLFGLHCESKIQMQHLERIKWRRCVFPTYQETLDSSLAAFSSLMLMWNLCAIRRTTQGGNKNNNKNLLFVSLVFYCLMYIIFPTFWNLMKSICQVFCFVLFLFFM